MNQPGSMLFDRILSVPPGNAGALTVLQLSAFFVLAICSALVWLAGEKGIWGITLCLLVVVGLYIRKLRILKARHPVILKENGFVIGQTESDFVPLESVTDIEHLGWVGWNVCFPTAYGGCHGFKVSFNPAHPRLGTSFVFVVLADMIQREYKTQYQFRQAILLAAKNRKTGRAGNPNQPAVSAPSTKQAIPSAMVSSRAASDFSHIGTQSGIKNRHNPLPFDGVLSIPPRLARFYFGYLLFIYCVFFGLSAWIWLTMANEIWPIIVPIFFLVMIGRHISQLPLLKAKHPVFLKEKGFMVGKEGNDFVPFDSLIDIKYLGSTLFNSQSLGLFNKSYKFEVQFRPTLAVSGASFVFLASSDVIKKAYGSPQRFRETILHAAKDRTLSGTQRQKTDATCHTGPSRGL